MTTRASTPVARSNPLILYPTPSNTQRTHDVISHLHDVIYRRPNLEAFSESYWSGSYMTPPRLSTLVSAADAPPKEAAAGAE